jgi:hypothetical protein
MPDTLQSLEPMSEDELGVLINQCMGVGGVRVFEFANAIEAHHGIGVKP